MGLYNEIINQVNICERKEKYACGILLNKSFEDKVIMDIFRIVSKYKDFEICNNGKSIRNRTTNSYIHIVRTNSDILSKRLCHLIVSSLHNDEFVYKTITPLFKNSINQITRCDISFNDVYMLETFIETTNKIIMDDIILDKNIAIYECEFNGLVLGKGVVKVGSIKLSERETNGKKYISYAALGMSKKDITYETEFINRTGEMYVNIKGEYVNEVYGIDEKLDVHYKVDTDVYDAYKVVINHGFVTIVLYEKKNEQPVLKDLGKRDKTEKSSNATENNNTEDVAE